MVRKEVIGITIDKKTKDLIDDYGNDHSISRSAVIRLACNDFFIKLGDAK